MIRMPMYTPDQTGMGQHLLHHLPPAHMRGHEITGPHGPHDHPRRGSGTPKRRTGPGIHTPLRQPDTPESRCWTPGFHTAAPFPGIRIPVEQEMIQPHEEELQNGSGCQDPAAGEKKYSPQKGIRQDLMMLQGIITFTTRSVRQRLPDSSTMFFFAQIESDEDHQEQGKLQIPQPYDIHGTPPLR